MESIRVGFEAVASKRNKACLVWLRVPGVGNVQKCALQVSGVDSGVEVCASKLQGSRRERASRTRVRGKQARKRLKGDRRGGQDGRSWSLTVEAPRPIEKSPVALAPENSNMSASGWV